MRRRQFLGMVISGLLVLLVLVSATQSGAVTDITINFNGSVNETTCPQSSMLFSVYLAGNNEDRVILDYFALTITDANGVVVDAVGGEIRDDEFPRTIPIQVDLQAINVITARPIFVRLYDVTTEPNNADPANYYQQIVASGAPLLAEVMFDPANRIPSCAALPYINATSTPIYTSTSTFTPTHTHTPTFTHTGTQTPTARPISTLTPTTQQLAQQIMTASDGSANDAFGWAVAISDDTFAASAPYADDGISTDSGAVYVFVRSGAVWIQQTKLTPADPENNLYFGRSIALAGDRLIVGAPGDGTVQDRVYVFQRSGTIWTQTARLSASDGAPPDNFGWSVSMSGQHVLVGAPGNINATAIQGAAYLFGWNGTAWSQVNKWTAPGTDAAEAFGHSVDLDDQTAVIGTNSLSHSGSVYVYLNNGEQWGFQQRLTSSDPRLGDQFGFAVTLWDDALLIGSPGYFPYNSQGAITLFHRINNSWQDRYLSLGNLNTQRGQVIDMYGSVVVEGWPQSDGGSGYFTDGGIIEWYDSIAYSITTFSSGGSNGEQLGHSVARGAQTIVVGAPYRDDGAVVDAGGVDVYTISGPIWGTPTATITPTPSFTPSRTPTPTNTIPPNATPELNMFSTLDVTLTWNRLTWAAQYEVQIDNAMDFLTPIHTSPPLNASSLSYLYTAPADGRYYWRVRGRDANNIPGAWSVTGSFVVDATP
jgi:hypothetical protein